MTERVTARTAVLVYVGLVAVSWLLIWAAYVIYRIVNP